MKKLVLVFILPLLLFTFIPNINADTPNTYKVHISIVDNNGNALDASQFRAFASCAKVMTWGKGQRFTQTPNYSLKSEVTEKYIQLSTTAYDDIQFTIGSDNSDFACFISDKVKKQELNNGSVIQKVYKVSDLKKVNIKTDFMNRTTGKYEVSIYNPQNTTFEADNYGSLFEMKDDGTKLLYVSPGKFNYVFKYVDRGVCAVTYKDNVNALDTKSISISKDNVSMTKYSYKIPKPLDQYIYYIMHADKDNHRFYLNGLFSENSTLDFYMDKRINPYNQNLILSKNPDDEYDSSVWLPIQSNIPTNIGSSYSPGSIEVFTTMDKKTSIKVKFADISGNNIHFVDISRDKDTVIEVYDKLTGVKLYTSTVSKYWDYFNPQLKNGSYIAKVYPVEKALGIDGCTYYDLNVNSATPTIYKFTKLFSLKI